VLQEKIWPNYNINKTHFMKSMDQEGVLWISKEQTKQAKLYFEAQLKEKH
jgi:hypothetical protein